MTDPFGTVLSTAISGLLLGFIFSAGITILNHRQPIHQQLNAFQSLVSKFPTDKDTTQKLKKLMDTDAFKPNKYGEQGKGIDVPQNLKKMEEERFIENYFNVVASEMISVNRTLPDYRSDACRASGARIQTFGLPKASVIIIFHNEAWTTLIRSLHSIVNRSPRHLLEEIILVDDKSDHDWLKKPLDVYIKQFEVPVHLIHLQKRSGLIRARLAGSDSAKGEIMIFLDSHIEVTKGWIEPLISRVAEDKTRVVAPIIDVINYDDFRYETGLTTLWGGFNWVMNFKWYDLPKRVMDERKEDSEIIKTPTIAGGLFAIDRHYFYDIGAYDQGMEVWGAENLEMSFRIWMCGGSMEIHPCSRVGHIFRKQTPYEFPGGKNAIIHRNIARTVEVWADEHKEFFYQVVPTARKMNIGDLTERKQLRESLQCKSFKWYLENVYPEANIPSHFYSLGAIKNLDNGKCVDRKGLKLNGAPGLTDCRYADGNQAWTFSGSSELRSDDICFAVNDNGLAMEKCDEKKEYKNQKFAFDEKTGHLIHQKSGKCVTANDSIVQIETCEPEQKNQVWELEGFKKS